MNLIKLPCVAAVLPAQAPLAAATLPAAILTPMPARPATVADDAAGMIKTAKGSVTIERAGRKAIGAAGALVMASDCIVPGADGSAGRTLRDATRMALGPDTTLSMEHFAFNSTTHEGRLDASVRRGMLAKQSPAAVKFSMLLTVPGVRGTEFVMEADGNE